MLGKGICPPVFKYLFSRLAMQKLLSIVIPALNEEHGIDETLGAVPEKELGALGYKVEIIVVDGNSKDRTREIAKRHGAKVILEKKRGYGLALRTGFNAASGEFIVSSDADHTYPLEKIPELLNLMKAYGLDFLSTNRFESMEAGAMSGRNRLGNWALSSVARILFSIPFQDSQSGMWLMRKGVWEKIAQKVKDNRMAFSQEIKIEAFRNGFKCSEIPVRYGKRHGEVKLNAWKDGIGNLMALFSKRMA